MIELPNDKNPLVLVGDVIERLNDIPNNCIISKPIKEHKLWGKCKCYKCRLYRKYLDFEKQIKGVKK